ncbi:MAG: hypothetical protein QMD88_05245 [Coprothermobacterota bacterium]|nr:hypothetical protein [Coprothermobacterota bacterium]
MKFTKESGVIMDERIEPEERREEDLNREEFRERKAPGAIPGPSPER